MAPMAGRIPDGEQNRAVQLASTRKRFLAPREPVDRILGVLEEIGAGLPSESVAHRSSLLFVRGGSARAGGDASKAGLDSAWRSGKPYVFLMRGERPSGPDEPELQGVLEKLEPAD